MPNGGGPPGQLLLNPRQGGGHVIYCHEAELKVFTKDGKLLLVLNEKESLMIERFLRHWLADKGDELFYEEGIDAIYDGLQGTHLVVPHGPDERPDDVALAERWKQIMAQFPSAPKPKRKRKNALDVSEDEIEPMHNCRRLLLMVRELHEMGYQRLRIAPGMSSSGMYWRCSIVPATNIDRGHSAMLVDFDKNACHYSSGAEAEYFGWTDAVTDSPRQLAEKFVNRFPELADLGRGQDPEYARWYKEMLRRTEPNGLVIAYADWDLPKNRLSTINMTKNVTVRMPPNGEV